LTFVSLQECPNDLCKENVVDPLQGNV